LNLKTQLKFFKRFYAIIVEVNLVCVLLEMSSWNSGKVVYLGIFTGIAIALHILEGSFSPLFPVPGAKVGLANIVTLFVFFTVGPRDALLVLLLRILVGNLLGGTFLNVGFFLSVSGGLSSFLALCVLSKRMHSVAVLSVISAVVHNLVQLLVAFSYIESRAIFLYLPFLVFSGVTFGFFCGYAGAFLISVWRQRFAGN